MAAEFKIVLQPEMKTGVSDAWASIKQFCEDIVEKAKELLKKNVPEWPIVEAELRSAFDTYVRPIDIPRVPNFIEGKLEDWLLETLIATIKDYYQKLVVA